MTSCSRKWQLKFSLFMTPSSKLRSSEPIGAIEGCKPSPNWQQSLCTRDKWGFSAANLAKRCNCFLSKVTNLAFLFSCVHWKLGRPTNVHFPRMKACIGPPQLFFLTVVGPVLSACLVESYSQAVTAFIWVPQAAIVNKSAEETAHSGFMGRTRWTCSSFRAWC